MNRVLFRRLVGVVLVVVCAVASSFVGDAFGERSHPAAGPSAPAAAPVPGAAPAAAPANLKPPHGGMVLVGQDDLGNPAAQPHLIAGAGFALTEEDKKASKIDDDRYLHFAYHESAVQLRFIGLRPEAKYILRVHYFNVTQDRTVRLLADGVELHDAIELPKGKAVVKTVDLPREIYRDAMVTVSCVKTAGTSALMSAIELWSDTPELLGPVGSFVRFRVDALPPETANLKVTGYLKIHSSPWNTQPFALTPKEGVSKAGLTPWVNLRTLPGGASGSLMLGVPAGAKGATQFSLVGTGDAVLREIGWDEPDGTRVIVEPGFMDIRTFREQERRYYLNALQQNWDRLQPLTRPPLMFSNAWGHASGPAAEYMVKTFRVLGLNSVETIADGAKYEEIYGWHSQGGQYSPPGFVPYDEETARGQFAEHYRKFFEKGGKGEGAGPGMRIFQLSDEPGEVGLKDSPEARAGFQKWAAPQGVEPGLFVKKAWEEVGFFTGKPATPEEKRLFYWTRMYQRYLTTKMFALASDAVREQSPGKQALSYVALSGHAMNFPSKQPLDMFQLAQYPNLVPGISDWMTGGSWWWDGHESVAYSVAPFNAGARRYGKEAEKGPVSFPMMHCVNPMPLRSYTQLANNCKLISYYTYGPDYEATEGFWSHVPWEFGVVGQLSNKAAQVDDILSPGTMRRSRVAMLYTDAQEIWWPQGSFIDKRATFLELAHSYYQPELVTERQVLDGALGDYDALFVLDQCVSRKAQGRVEEWVKSGGLLWACADAAVSDEYSESCDMLDRLAGVKRDFSAAPAGETEIAPASGQPEFPAHPVPAGVRPGVFKWEGSTVRATYKDGSAAWAQKEVGKGKVVYLAHRGGLALSRRSGKRGQFAIWPSAGRELLSLPLVEAKVDRELSLSATCVVASAISTPTGTVMVLFDLNATPPQDVVVSLKEPARPHSVQTFDDGGSLVDLPFEFADGHVRITLKTVKWNGQMIVVRRGPAPADDRVAAMRATAEAGQKSSDWQAASGAAWFAGFYPDWKLGPALVPLLKHEHWAVRRSAAESLGRLRLASAGGDLRDAIEKETDSHARAEELIALVQLRHRDAKKLCAKLRESADPFTRAEAERAEAMRAAMAKEQH
ncbi:MAG: HEAT repeat domain-containing protein [Planctomycetota bacterium]|nr:HEAT repeat domain-containing protein [Planctomycetota bacterium]